VGADHRVLSSRGRMLTIVETPMENALGRTSLMSPSAGLWQHARVLVLEDQVEFRNVLVEFLPALQAEADGASLAAVPPSVHHSAVSAATAGALHGGWLRLERPGVGEQVGGRCGVDPNNVAFHTIQLPPTRLGHS
jgi:hypothetical protein